MDVEKRDRILNKVYAYQHPQEKEASIEKEAFNPVKFLADMAKATKIPQGLKWAGGKMTGAKIEPKAAYNISPKKLHVGKVSVNPTRVGTTAGGLYALNKLNNYAHFADNKDMSEGQYTKGTVPADVATVGGALAGGAGSHLIGRALGKQSLSRDLVAAVLGGGLGYAYGKWSEQPEDSPE